MEFGCVSLRIWHPTRSLAFLSDVLGLEPFRTWVAGEAKQTPVGGPLEGIHDTSYWVSRLEFEPRVGFLRELTHAVELLSRSDTTLRDLAVSGGRIEIYVQLTGWINNGASIGPALLRTMADLGATLSIEVFAN